jgi:hypothetical protein
VSEPAITYAEILTLVKAIDSAYKPTATFRMSKQMSRMFSSRRPEVVQKRLRGSMKYLAKYRHKGGL